MLRKADVTCECRSPGYWPDNKYECSLTRYDAYCSSGKVCYHEGTFEYAYNWDDVCHVECRCKYYKKSAPKNSFKCSDSSYDAYCPSDKKCMKKETKSWTYPKTSSDWDKICY